MPRKTASTKSRGRSTDIVKNDGRRQNSTVQSRTTRRPNYKPDIVGNPKKRRGAAHKIEISTGEDKVAKKPETKAEKPRRHTMPAVLRVGLSIILLAGLATLITWYVFSRQYGDEAGTQIGEKPLVFVYSAIIVFFMTAILAAATWKPFFSAAFSFSILSILAFINEQKMMLRNAPLLPEELLLADQAGNIASFVDAESIRRLVFGIIFVIIGSILLEFYASKVLGREKKGLPFWEKHALIPRATFLMISLAGFSIVAGPALHRKSADWAADMTYVGWNQTENYTKNGFVIGFLNNLAPAEVPRPDNYNEETMRQLAEKYQEMKSGENRERKPLNEIADNVIIILDETFYDPEILTKYYTHTGGDVVPNLHRFFQKYPSGYMYSPEYGGNTSNVEFEVLTGLTNYWAKTLPYLNLVPKTGGLFAAPIWARENGFSTTAVHSYDGSMYKRDIVYPMIGFDKFISADEMKYTEKEGRSEYINDRSVFNEILDIIKDNNSPQMIGVVTMQNHSPYWFAHYPEFDYIINGKYSFLEENYQSIHYADQYLGEFIAALEELDEKVVVLWFGDHMAGILDDFVKSDEKVDRDTAHLTPYFIYTNFDIEYEGDVKAIAKERKDLGIEIDLPDYLLKTINLPLTTPNCLQNTMYDLIGAEKPAKFYLIGELCNEIPVLANAYWNEKDPATSDAAREILKEYELMNYDALAGKHYWEE